MRKILTSLFLFISFTICGSNLFAQDNAKASNSGEVKTFTTFSFTKISGENYIDLSIYILDKNSNTTLGISSFVMQYDSEALSYQFSPVPNAPLVKGYFCKGLKSYMDPYTMPYWPSCQSIEIDCDDSVVTIPDTATLLGIIRFKIINPTKHAGFTWKKTFSAVYGGNSKPINIDYIEPEPIYLLGMDLDFHADLTENKVLLLNRLTQSERVEKGVEIEKSKDGINFVAFEAIPKSGNSAQDLEYSAFDEHPYPGTSFYRLESKNKNGEKELLGMLIVHRPN